MTDSDLPSGDGSGQPHTDLLSSGFNDLIGFDIEVWQSDFVQLGMTIDSRHRNRSGTLHGGVLATLLDVAGGFSGCHCTREGHVRKAVTLSLSTNYTGQCKEGRVRVIGRRIGGGRKVSFSAAEVLDAQDNLLATAQGTYRYRSGSELPEGVPLEQA